MSRPLVFFLRKIRGQVFGTFVDSEAVMWYIRYFTRLWDDRHDESHWASLGTQWIGWRMAIFVSQLEVPETS